MPKAVYTEEQLDEMERDEMMRLLYETQKMMEQHNKRFEKLNQMIAQLEFIPLMGLPADGGSNKEKLAQTKKEMGQLLASIEAMKLNK